MFSLTVDKDIEIKVDATIKISVPEAATGCAVLKASYGGITSIYTGAKKIMYTIRNDQQVGLQIGYVDGDGNPASVDGNVVWESSDDSIASINVVSPDGMTVTLVAESNGQCQIKATADADLGAGVRELITLLDVTVVSGEAVAGVITPQGEAGPKP